MGREQSPRPVRPAAKLQQIRSGLGLTQQQMLERPQDSRSSLLVSHISDFELKLSLRVEASREPLTQAESKV